MEVVVAKADAVKSPMSLSGLLLGMQITSSPDQGRLQGRLRGCKEIRSHYLSDTYKRGHRGPWPLGPDRMPRLTSCDAANRLRRIDASGRALLVQTVQSAVSDYPVQGSVGQSGGVMGGAWTLQCPAQ